jgi:hypothetical protein
LGRIKGRASLLLCLLYWSSTGSMHDSGLRNSTVATIAHSTHPRKN